MAIQVACPSCQKALKAPDSAAGKRAKCPACGQVVSIPAAVQEAGEVVERMDAYPVQDAPPPTGFGDRTRAEQYAVAPAMPPQLPQGVAPVDQQQRKPCPMCGEMIGATAVQCRFCGAALDSPFQQGAPVGAVAPAYQAGYRQTALPPYTEQGFRSLYMWFAILYGVGIPAVLVLVGVFMIIAAVVLQWILVYRCWNVIQDGQARTTPGKAIGFLFIPFFNFYWIFVAVHGLAADMEEYCRQRSLPCAASPGLAMTLCILTLCGMVPYVGILAALANLVIVFILLNQFKETGITILRYRQAQLGVS